MGDGMKLFQLSVILRLILELVPFCRPPPPAKYYYGISIFEDCRAVFFSETSQVGYCNNFFQKFLEIGL